MPSVSSEISERMPLHASATSSVVLARIRTLPSRRTGISTAPIAPSPNLDASSCSGQCDLIEEDRRQRNHQDQKRQRKREDAQPGPAEKEEDDAHRGSEERDTRQEQLGSEHTADQHEDAADEDDQARNRRPLRRLEKAMTSLPGEVRGNGDDEEAVRVVVVSPPVRGKLRQHVPVQKQETGRDEQRRADSSRVDGHTGGRTRSKRPFQSKSSSARARRRLIDRKCLPGLSIAERRNPRTRDAATRKSAFSRTSSPAIPDFPTADRPDAAAIP